MKIFYSASISRSKLLLPISQDIVQIIESLGHEVLTKQLVDPNYSKDPQWPNKLDSLHVYSEAEQKLQQANVLITECTTPSFAAGWWIDKSLALNLPLLSLHYGDDFDNVPIMLRGRAVEINLTMYTEDNLPAVLKHFLNTIPQSSSNV